MGYKMNGFSGFGNSPMKKKTPELNKGFDIDKHLDKKEADTDDDGWKLMLDEKKAEIKERDAKMDRLMYRHKRLLPKDNERVVTKTSQYDYKKN